MQKVVYIAGLSHSGTTLLTLTLGQHSRFLGLGEVFGLVGSGYEQTRERKEVCSCGNEIDDCPVWSKVARTLVSGPELSREEQYKTIYQAIRDEFGPDTITVDSSKRIECLDFLRRNPDIDLKVIHVIKDVRAFAVSQLDVEKTRKAEGLPEAYHKASWQAKIRKRSALIIFRLWYKRNRSLQEYIKQHSLETLQVGFDEFILSPETMMPRVCDFLGVEPEDGMHSLENLDSHIIRGNRIRNRKEKRRIRYDSRWFNRREWILPALLFPGIMKYNAERVYGNTSRRVKPGPRK